MLECTMHRMHYLTKSSAGGLLSGYVGFHMSRLTASSYINTETLCSSPARWASSPARWASSPLVPGSIGSLVTSHKQERGCGGSCNDLEVELPLLN